MSVLQNHRSSPKRLQEKESSSSTVCRRCRQTLHQSTCPSATATRNKRRRRLHRRGAQQSLPFKMVSDLESAPIESRSSHIERTKTMQDIFVQLINDAANIIDNKAQPFQRPFIEAKMYKETIKVLHDTGANISAINENIF
jgi:hypothetical protein